MKRTDAQQNRRFEKQLTHLQSFIGMSSQITRKPSLSEIRENDRHLLAQQALGFEPRRENVFKRVFVGLINTASQQLKQVIKSPKKKALLGTSAQCS